MKRALALVAWIVIVLASPAALAAANDTQLTFDFDTLGEAPPSEICVVADYMSGPEHTNMSAAASLIEKVQKDTVSIRPKVSTACGANDTTNACAPSIDPLDAEASRDPKNTFWACAPGTGKGGVAVLFVGAVVVTDLALTDSVARVTLRQSPKTIGGLVHVRLLGGDYRAATPFSFPIAAGEQLVRMTLRPLCFVRDVTVPDVRGSCADLRWTGAECLGRSGAAYTLRIAENDGASSSLRASLCIDKQVFEAHWAGDRLPETIRLDSSAFTFDWRLNCLSGDACPNVEGDVHCDRGVKNGDVCRYTCGGDTKFPATVRFSLGEPVGEKESLERWWLDTLTAPGQELESYIPTDQRRVRLSWKWTDADRENRSGRAADRIDHVEVRTPGGQIHDIVPTATQVRIPELDCNDSLSYRYVGDRLFKEWPAPVSADANGVAQVTFDDPSTKRIDNVGIAFALGAGGRYIGGGGPASWGPYGEAQIVLVFRQLRDLFPTDAVGVDLDLRGGAIFLGQPYCSNLATGSTPVGACSIATGTSGSTSGTSWERVPFWMIPFTLGPNLLFPSNFTAGFGLGVTLTTFHVSSDAPKVGRAVLATAVGHVGYRLTRAVTAEAQGRLLMGEDVRERDFDESGVLSERPANGSGPAVLLGGVIRVDDLF